MRGSSEQELSIGDTSSSASIHARGQAFMPVRWTNEDTMTGRYVE